MTVNKNIRQITKCENGSALVMVCVMMTVLLGFSALVVDVGFINHQKADMQKAADAAALAGAKHLPQETAAHLNAIDMCFVNDYKEGVEGVGIQTRRNRDGVHPGWYTVEISKPVNYFFAPILGYHDGVINVAATACYTSPLPINISGGGNYGFNGIQNLSVFGPYGQYTYGDAFSTRWLDNGSPNPDYQKGGYNFKLSVPANYFAINGTNQMKVELFDPDTWNVGDAQDASSTGIDEIRYAPGGSHPQPSSKYTTTKFQLFAPDNTPDNYDDDTLIAESIYTPSMKTSDMKWVTPTGWTVNLSSYGIGDYRINVKTTDGSSENGFNLRAGPPRATGVPFNSNNGTKITATGNLPVNFNTSGTVNIELGDIPSDAAGFNVYIDKFDTDVGAKSVSYYDDLGNSWPGYLSNNGEWKLDTITIPQGYPGSKLHARYQAGAQDTSDWQMYFDGFLPGSPATLKLVE